RRGDGMKGDVIIVEEHHRRAAAKIAAALEEKVREAARTYTVSVAGESGSGKSETAAALREEFEKLGFVAAVLQQDDYFVLPPKSNDAKRREDITWVGASEVRVELLDSHLAAAQRGEKTVTKPLVIYDEDRITEEEMSLEGLEVLIAEGTYTMLLEHVDTKVFINRNRLETLESRKKRGREEIEPFLEQVLEIEHNIISKHITKADIVIDRNYEVRL
ncbi:MAG: uridine kinase, partial [Spirochaetaceae bacterium]